MLKTTMPVDKAPQSQKEYKSLVRIRIFMVDLVARNIAEFQYEADFCRADKNSLFPKIL